MRSRRISRAGKPRWNGCGKTALIFCCAICGCRKWTGWNWCALSISLTNICLWSPSAVLMILIMWGEAWSTARPIICWSMRSAGRGCSMSWTRWGSVTGSSRQAGRCAASGDTACMTGRSFVKRTCAGFLRKEKFIFTATMWSRSPSRRTISSRTA